MNARSRYDDVGRMAAIGILLVLGLLVAWGVAAGAHDGGASTSSSDDGDAALYRSIAARVHDGQSYYSAVDAEQPARGYPTAPVMTVREPVLSWLVAALGRTGATLLLVTIAVAAVVVAVRVFDRLSPGRASWFAATFLAGATAAVMCVPTLVYFHESWAGLLMFIALLLRSRTRTTVVLLVVASIIRELVAPSLGLVALLAWRRGQRREARCAVYGLAIFVMLYAGHAVAVRRWVGSSSASSPGWLGLHGWPLVVDAVRLGSPLLVLPFVVAAVCVPLALLGWTSLRGAVPETVSLALVCFMAAFAVLARWNNLYWGLLIGVMLLPGLAFAPRALVDLVRSALGRARVASVSRPA